jgi:hypothetical protein
MHWRQQQTATQLNLGGKRGVHAGFHVKLAECWEREHQCLGRERQRKHDKDNGHEFEHFIVPPGHSNIGSGETTHWNKWDKVAMETHESRQKFELQLVLRCTAQQPHHPFFFFFFFTLHTNLGGEGPLIGQPPERSRTIAAGVLWAGFPRSLVQNKP